MDKIVRQEWDDKSERRLFSVVDVITVLTRSKNPAVYWRVLKNRLEKEGGNETVTKCNGLKMLAADGKMRITDVADVETLLRIIQSIPSPNAEPVKQWLAKVGYERLEEIKDPEKAIQRGIDTYTKKGYSDEWIGYRLRSVDTRKGLTHEWSQRGIMGIEYAVLTNEIYKGWSGMTAQEYQNLKGLTDENLRDHMNSMELILTMLAEATTREVTKSTDAHGFVENKSAAQLGSSIASSTKKQIEETTHKPIITPDNYLPDSNERIKLE
ncbi:hypothetical protein A3C17_04625 [Candidatus Uhrbacteria bacterium RIFCSPHIGHO2_02_FULL_53_13]|uniref:Bro-N domain-containing protein n=1 Tax=Candidatus Uhrbacteria bacterium RIFCSPHIGHO2_02_FULL_53_13 TaxID=1802389 RepID=A0A1F7U190_9BACT|nr:MAG: hypothetical protein A3C17_04625 [Candidatus Uhrbacteria bacterium RIFCSPHIGHO2_02_FULL_53_13]